MKNKPLKGFSPPTWRTLGLHHSENCLINILMCHLLGPRHSDRVKFGVGFYHHMAMGIKVQVSPLKCPFSLIKGDEAIRAAGNIFRSHPTKPSSRGNLSTPPPSLLRLIPFCDIAAQRGQWVSRVYLNSSWYEELRPSKGGPAHFRSFWLSVIRKFFLCRADICLLDLLLPNCHNCLSL